MKKTIESISIFLVISLVFTLPFTNTYYDFAKYFLLVSVIQYILTYIYFNYLQFYAVVKYAAPLKICKAIKALHI